MIGSQKEPSLIGTLWGFICVLIMLGFGIWMILDPNFRAGNQSANFWGRVLDSVWSVRGGIVIVSLCLFGFIGLAGDAKTLKSTHDDHM